MSLHTLQKHSFKLHKIVEKKTYMLTMEGTFSEDMITTGTSLQEDPCSAISIIKKKKKIEKQKEYMNRNKRKEKAKAYTDPEISNFSFFFLSQFFY